MKQKGITRREFAVADRSEIIEILDKCKVVNLGLVDGDEPYVVPMNYGYTMDDNGNLAIYLHGALEGYKIDLIRKNPKAFIEMHCDIESFEGDIACKYGMAYASLMGRGTAELIDDVEDKIRGLEILMKTQTGRDFEITAQMVKVVSIIRINVIEYTAKKRAVPND